MKKLLAMSALSATLLISPTAFAHEIDAKDPQKIADLMRTTTDAIDIKVGKDSGGDPRITFKQNEMKQAIYFYGCKDGKNCTSIQFVFVGSESGHTISTINDFNSEYRFAKAYLDKDNDAVLQMDVVLNHKVSKAYLSEVFKRWDELSASFILNTLLLD